MTTPKLADTSKFDPNGAGDTRANVFGLSFTAEESSVILIPVPWEATVSYGRGTAQGPTAIRKASPQLDLFDAEYAAWGMPRPWAFGIFMEKSPASVVALNKKATGYAAPVIAVGGDVAGNRRLERSLAAANEASAKVNAWVEKRVLERLDEGKIPGLLGGEHSVSFGAIAACAKRHSGLGILHVDAHADLRNAYEGFSFSHASIMHNVMTRIGGVGKLVQVGIRDFCDSEYELATRHDRIHTWFDAALHAELFAGTPWARLVERILSELPDEVYVSFDIDGLDPANCPHTGTPVPGGLSFQQATYLLSALARSGRRIVGFDLTEVAPSRKSRGDEWDGNVGARILYKLCAAALYSQGARG